MLRTPYPPGRVRRMAFLADGRLAVTSADDRGRVRIVDSAGGVVAQSRPLRLRGGPASEVAVRADTGEIVFACGRNGRVEHWDAVRNAYRPPPFTSGLGGSPVLALSPDGATLFATGPTWFGGWRVRRWDLNAGRELEPTPAICGPIFALACSADGGRLAVGGNDRSVRLYDAAGKPLPSSFVERLVVWFQGLGQAATGVNPPLAQKAHVRALAFAPDRPVLAAGVGWSVAVADVTTGGRPKLLTGHRGMVRCVAFHPAGRTLATAADDGTVRFWDADAGREVARYEWELGKVSAVAFAPDGLTCAAGGEAQALVRWDVDG